MRTTIPRQLIWPLGQPISDAMENGAANTLQNYAPGMYRVLADIVLTAFLFGCLTVLSIISAFHLMSVQARNQLRTTALKSLSFSPASRRGIKLPSTGFMLGSVFILYAATTTDFAIKTTYVVAHGRLLNAAVSALESTPPSSTDMALIQFGQSAQTASYITGAVYAVNITLGDIIVWWRVCVLWQRRSTMALGLALIVGTFVLGILSTIHFKVDPEVQPLLSYADTYGGVSALLLLSFVSNVLATSLIGIKAWEHRKILRQSPGASKGRWKTPIMKVLMLLVESGTIYSVLFCSAAVGNIMLRFKSSLLPGAQVYVTLSMVFFTGCFVPMLAIYPTLIVFIVALNRSEIDGTLAKPGTPSDISTNMLPSLFFQDSATTIHLSPNADHPPNTERAFNGTDPEDLSGERCRVEPSEGKPEEADELV